MHFGKNAYEILGVSQTASQENLRVAYKRKALELHPDKQNRNTDTDENDSISFQQLQEAFELLSDPARRAVLDSRQNAEAAATPITPSDLLSFESDGIQTTYISCRCGDVILLEDLWSEELSGENEKCCQAILECESCSCKFRLHLC